MPAVAAPPPAPALATPATGDRSRAGRHLGDHGAQRPGPVALDLADDGRRHIQIPRRGRPRPAPTHEGTLTAANGHWTLHALKGLSKDYGDGGSYEIHDTIAVITGKLGTGYWKRSVE